MQAVMTIDPMNGLPCENIDQSDQQAKDSINVRLGVSSLSFLKRACKKIHRLEASFNGGEMKCSISSCG